MAAETAYMRQALEQGKIALDHGEVPVGCIFVHDGKVIGRAANMTNETCNATRHAELVAIDDILQAHTSDIFKACTLYVTVEPCIMCASALAQLGVREIYFGCHNDRFGGCGSVLNLHEESNCRAGVLKNEAIDLLRLFYAQTNTAAPEGKRKRKRISTTTSGSSNSPES